MLTKEFIESLSAYLASRVEKYGGTEDSPTTILEVGAGNGRLAHFLERELREHIGERVRIVGCDSSERKIKHDFPVERLDYRIALQRVKPDIVVSSWMPHGVDWTKSFRDTDSVKEYLLIGEPHGGACGDEWQTWGVPVTVEQRAQSEQDQQPWEADGFADHELEEVSRYQICRSDRISELREDPDSTHSSTISFVRKSGSS